ncbi:MAG: NAD-dependent deacylase [Parvularculaceae bacterium]
MSKRTHIVVLTGAGVSAESGLDTFRDKGGIWARYDYRDVATPEGFAANPALVHEFYNMRRTNLANVEPNAAHLALAALERRILGAGGAFTLITQNVDDLHERAGSQNVIHMHGELKKARCAACDAVHAWAGDLSASVRCPDCKAVGEMRPHVVWFGEIPLRMEEIAAALVSASRFVSIGTSGSVYPAAGFVAEVRAMGVPCTEMNLEPSENAWAFSDARYGAAGDIVPAWADEIFPSTLRP